VVPRPYLVNGEWRTGTDSFEVHSPFDDSVVAEIGSPTEADVEEAAATAEIVFRLIERAGPTDKAILIQGESGTGKELVARALQRASLRADKPFVVINCAALPESLLESELFGHEKGSFTGAVAAKQGLFEVADGGTLFIDEIGELAGSLQAKLLRVLEEREVMRGQVELVDADEPVGHFSDVA
jgi:transcriptional regulator with PAS, ATPase and Fis domain